jgi:hypothetical protein
MYQTRAALLKNFGPNMLRPGEPWSDLGNLFPLIYMFHQYEINAVVNMVGGAEIPPALRGDGQTPIRVYPADVQRRALATLMQALDPQQLEIAPELWQSLAPFEGGGGGGGGFGGDPERFRSSANYLFSPEDGARAVCELILGGLLEPARVQRVITIEHERSDAMRVADLLNSMIGAAFPAGEGAQTSLQRRIVQTELAERLMILAADANATPEVRAFGWAGVDRVASIVGEGNNDFGKLIAQEIAAFRRDPKNNVPKLKPSGAPAGPPI